MSREPSYTPPPPMWPTQPRTTNCTRLGDFVNCQRMQILPHWSGNSRFGKITPDERDQTKRGAIRPGDHHINPAWLLICGILIGGKANGQQQLDVDAVRAANQAFSTALSTGDVPAMRKVWSSDPDTTNIGPGSKAVAVGWDAIGTVSTTRDAFPDLKSHDGTSHRFRGDHRLDNRG